ncbi:myosin phosphatase Rho-interacting protein-like isoform X2 [Betta splendens]|uniref:Myosin phosphatase Rho-interacting protein-like isoform X2 n=1 Tax=Betta splendens TaxID=158456 RepID=A0A6P7N686_BETSP|nr:myosin phosphatase Rho-interacting protein-like isoform X2 [Betta splendens]
MSAEKATSPCNKFQANIFNKSKCQNCFKSRELHLLNDRDMEQAKPIYGGWLCLAPEGTDFDNPMQRSRKWQRRFFILYEHGSLSFALDELPSTLPQGTLNMNLCTDITDAEPRTAQRNALCIVTPEQEIFIRGDNKEIINGWSEQLSVYLRINKQNLKKKRKVEPVATQEPSPAKMAATDSNLTFCESSTISSHCIEDQQSRRPDVTSVWTVTDPPGLEQTPAGKSSSYLPVSVSKEAVPLNGGSSFSSSVLDLPLDENNSMHTPANEKDQRMSIGSTAERILGSEVTVTEQEEEAALSRKSRSEARTSKREKLQSCGDISQLSVHHPHRRAKSLDGRTSDNVMTPDLLNFKKGWMVKLDENDQWKKYWFVLSTDSLRYYKDSVAEEASHVEGEIDLTKCHNVSEYQVQRNYGFQINTSKATFTLSAMTAGIRRNWIQALMKNVHPANAPDVASLPGHHVPCSTPEALPKPDVTQDSPSTDVPTERDSLLKPKNVTDRRRGGRYKTFDWTGLDFSPQNKPTPETDPRRTEPPCSLEMVDLERRKRREERRRRYEHMLGFSLSWEKKTVAASVRALSPTSQHKIEEDIEERWKQVENTVFRLERAVPLYTKDKADVEKLLDSYRTWAEELKAKLVESEHRVLELEAQLSSGPYQQQQLDPLLIEAEADVCPWEANETSLNSQTLSLNTYEETNELLQQQNLIEQETNFSPQTPSIWLHDTEGNLQDLGHLLPNNIPTLLLSPSSDNQDLLSPADGQAVELNLNAAESAHKDMTNSEDSELILTSEAQINNNGYSSRSLSLSPDQAAVRRLSQEVELLTGQNQALNQRNQEMLNQLTEADREIERLKAELNSRYADCTHHLPEVEQQGNLRVEDLERELSLRNQELLEAQTLIISLEESLRETEALLHMNIPAATEVEGEVKSDGATKAEEYMLRCFEATEAKLTELERQLSQSEMTCRELQVQNSELKEAEKFHCQKAAEVEISRLNQGLEEQRTKHVSAEERIQQVIDGMVVRLEALRRLLEVIDRLNLEKEHDEEPTVVGQVRWEKVFWNILLSELQASPSQPYEGKSVETLLREGAEYVILEKQVLLLGHGLRNGGHTSEALKDLDIIRSNASFTGTDIQRPDGRDITEFNHQVWDIERVRALTQMKLSLLTHIRSSVETAPDELQLMADRLYHFYFSDGPWSGFIHSAATEALYCWRLSRLHSKYEREREDNEHRLLTLSLNCSNCVKLMEKNRELEARIQASLCDNKRDSCCQTEDTFQQDIDTGIKITKEDATDEIREVNEKQFETIENFMEILLPDDVEGHLGIQEIPDENTQESNDIHEETVSSQEMDQVSVLRRRVEELEELLSVIPEEMKEAFDEQMSSVQMQHKKEVEKLKATCQHGLASVQESHLKAVEELHRRHRQEVERLLTERDRLLEEESAATATAIEAIKNAHRLELERELQRRCQSENSSGNADLQDVYRQHGEEVASYQRELEVLSQQFSLKCLENGHLVQALDAERKALCQCQQENQDLSTRNQELSGNLAAEITRLCSLSVPLSQGTDVYEMEITLRVKESELQCLKQVITSLKEELQSAQRDKRNATKKYNDTYTELSIVRAKAEREMSELRENLRLAHRALGQTSP